MMLSFTPVHLLPAGSWGRASWNRLFMDRVCLLNESVRSNNPRAQPQHSGLQLLLAFSSSPPVLTPGGPVLMVALKPGVGTEGQKCEAGRYVRRRGLGLFLAIPRPPLCAWIHWNNKWTPLGEGGSLCRVWEIPRKCVGWIWCAAEDREKAWVELPCRLSSQNILSRVLG